MPLSITTWNINSVRLRLPLVQQFVEREQPDILCLQETKVVNDLFPLMDAQALGYPHIAYEGEKSYNGVAIFSKLPLSNIHSVDFAETGHKRHIAASLPDGTTIHNVYIPAGGDIPDPKVNPKFDMKLRFVEALTEWSAGLKDTAPTVLLGDFNIAPLEHDVWSSRQLRNVVSHTDIEREKLGILEKAHSWQDSVRHFVPEDEKVYSWWSYRARDWQASNRGRKLDHIWVNAPLTERLERISICKDARGWLKPSDHAPVTTYLRCEGEKAAC